MQFMLSGIEVIISIPDKVLNCILLFIKTSIIVFYYLGYISLTFSGVATPTLTAINSLTGFCPDTT